MASAFWRSSVRRISKSVLEPLIHRRRWYSSKPRRFAALWGNGDYGRLGLGSLESRWKPTVCPFFRDDHPVSIVCGGAHTLFLTESGRVFATGLNNFGQLGITSSKSHTLVPVEIFGLPEKVVEISAGYHHSCAITDNGKLFVWGDNSSGQLGLGRKAGKTVSSPTKVDCLVDVTVRMAALGAEHSIVVTDEGNVLSWGAGGAGRLGHGHQSSILGFYVSSSECTPRLIKYFDAIKIKRIAAGMLHSACVDGEGELYTWGSNENGCLGLGFTDMVRTPQCVKKSSFRFPVSEVSCGWKHTAVISGRRVFTWGWGGANGTFFEDGHSSGGQLGHGNDIDYFEPTMVNFSHNVKALHVSCGFNHTGAIFEYSET
ncbi:ultraviolet-B receptor UVR8 isoform X5 [Ananas comosus]|uniref:Ultraviolet-B receptor UVR8 isoform X5 n=1 Tax=Ananas comosus TaxID=4615 RepID=A0A6P5GEX4_ANACO|nr:ultraviolet-B receptor UVR8 isoform X5 [Ananas comosus]